MSMNKIVQRQPLATQKTLNFFFQKLKQISKKWRPETLLKIFLFPRLVVVRQFADRFQMQVDFVISSNFSQAHQMYVLNNIKWAHCLVKFEAFFFFQFYCLNLTYSIEKKIN